MVIRKRKVVSVKNIVVYYNKKRLYLFRKRLSLVKISMIIEKNVFLKKSMCFIILIQEKKGCISKNKHVCQEEDCNCL